jgi:outer membrane protein OmpA-like peptidoglycan-associated protein
MADSSSSDKGRVRTTAQLKTLRNLIAGPTNRRLEGVEQQIESPDHQARIVSRVLPKALTISATKDNRLAAALGPILEKAIQTSIVKDRRILADALFPVIGPAISKAIASAIQGMIDNFNQVLDQSLSLKGLRWRLEAFRTRRPFAEIVLLNTLVYQVEQVFLIQREAGLLLSHVFAKTAVSKDPDLVSGMLTAIQDFVHDSFGSDRDDTVGNFQVGERKIWIEHGTSAMLALVIRGNPPNDLKEMMRDALDEIQLKYADELSMVDGDCEALEASHPILNGLLQAQFKKGRSRSSIFPWIALAVVLGLIGWGVFMHISNARRLTGFVDRLRSQPGVIVTQVKKQDGRIHIDGMKDPYAPGLLSIMEDSGIPEHSVEFTWEPYQSAHPEFVLRRIVALLKPPSTVTLAFEHGTLQINGAAPNQWIKDARRFSLLVPWVEQVDDHLIVNINERLNAPSSVTFELQGKKLIALGSAPRTWKERTPAAAMNLSEIDAYEDKELITEDDPSWEALSQSIGNFVFYYEGGGSILAKGQEKKLQAFIQAVKQMIALSRLLNHPIRIDVFGHADASGNEAFNIAVSQERAKVFADLLIGLGMGPSFVTAYGEGSKDPVDTSQDEASRARNRRVTFKIRNGDEINWT